MKKIFLLFLLQILNSFYGLASCPNPKDIYMLFQKTLQIPDNESELLKLKELCQKCNIRDSTYTRILQKIAENFHLKQEYSQADSYIQEAILLNSYPQKNIKQIFLIDNYLLSYKIMDDKGNYQKALNICDLCISTAMIFHEKMKYIPQMYSRKANILTKMGDFEKAIIQANIGIKFSEQLNDSLSILCLCERAKAFIITERLKEAKVDLEKALKISLSVNSVSLPYVYYWLAQFSSKEGNLLKAIDFYKKAQKLYKNSKNEYS